MQALFRTLFIIGLAIISTGCQATATPRSQVYGQLINLKGASNAQDLGGIETQTDRAIQPHRLIRSNQLAHLTKRDVRVLTNRYHLKTVADLRSNSEIQAIPDVEINNVTYYQDSVATAAGQHHVKSTYYRELVTTPTAVRGYQALFQQLLANRQGALLYHCTYGKDRTGVATVLILSALGVSRRTILREYLRSNYNLSRGSKLAFIDPSHPNQNFTRVSSADLTATYEQIDRRYGSMAKFLRHLGLTATKQKQLQQDYLTAN